MLQNKRDSCSAETLQLFLKLLFKPVSALGCFIFLQYWDFSPHFFKSLHYLHEVKTQEMPEVYNVDMSVSA